LSFLLSSCSLYQESESMQAKIARMNSTSSNINPVPYIELPRHIMANTKTKVKAPHAVNSKHLYFTSLYRQYNELSRFTKSSDKLNHCPAFHNKFLKERQRAHFSKKEVSQTKLLTLGKKGALKSFIKDDHLDLDQYAHSTLKELKEFCQTGTTHNFYNFANIITHIKKNHTAFHSNQKQSLRSLLKTSIFANRAIISSLRKVEKRGRFPASAPLKDSSLDIALGTNWAQVIFDEM